jgi:hypothetical protein
MNINRLIGAAVAIGAGLTAILALSGSPAANAASTAAAGPYNWLGENPAASPPALNGPVMAYDPASEQTILFGFSGMTSETWDWNGRTWNQLNVSGSPQPRTGTTLAYDPALGDLVLFGGLGDNNQYYNDTWLWNGTQWQDIQATPSSPQATEGGSLAYDPASSQLVFFGGQDADDLFADTYTFSASTLTWTGVHVDDEPQPRDGAALAYDPADQELVLYGGLGYSGGSRVTEGDTWLWNGSDWSTASNPAPNPPPVSFGSLAYDPTTDQLLLDGGIGAAPADSLTSQTWEWTGIAWTELSPAAVPPASSAAALTYDGATAQLVLFGGQDASGQWQAGTWTYGPRVSAPAITTTADSATFTATEPGAFTVGVSGYPLPLVTETGALPAGVSLSPTGVLSGTPPNGTGNAYNLIISASNGFGITVTQDFRLIVDQSPIITSSHSATFVAGADGRFKVKALAYPQATFSETGPLPAGLTLTSSGVLSGTPQAGTEGTYKIELIAANSAGTGTQKFTLTVANATGPGSAPIIDSPNKAAFVVGSPGKFTVKANAEATFTETGTLPPGVTLSSDGVLSGVPDAEGTYKIELLATNSGGTGKQAFTLTVEG